MTDMNNTVFLSFQTIQLHLYRKIGHSGLLALTRMCGPFLPNSIWPPFRYFSKVFEMSDMNNLQISASSQGCSQRGVQGVQLNPPSKLMIFMAIVYALWKN